MSDSYKNECALLAACTKMLSVLSVDELTNSQRIELYRLYCELERAWVNYQKSYPSPGSQADLFGGG